MPEPTNSRAKSTPTPVTGAGVQVRPMSEHHSELRLGDVLPARDLIWLYGAAEHRSLRSRNMIVFEQGAPCEALYELLSGRIRLVRTQPGGRRQIVRYVEPGVAFDPASILDGGPNTVTATTVEPSQVLAIPRDHVLHIISQSPGASIVLTHVLSTQLRNALALVGDPTLRPVSTRLAYVLLQETVPHDDAGTGTPVIRVTRGELAEILGTSREAISGALRELETSGAIWNERGYIRVTDPEELRRFIQTP